MSFRTISGIVFVLFAGCSGNDITDPNDIVFPQTNVSFSAQVQPLLNISCNSYGCHDAARTENLYVQLTSWAGVRNVRVVNQPGDTNSGLIRVVYGRQLHSGVIRINDNHRQGLKQWVLEGAQNN